METRPLICSANQRTGFYMITAFVMKGLKLLSVSYFSIRYRYLRLSWITLCKMRTETSRRNKNLCNKSVFTSNQDEISYWDETRPGVQKTSF